MLCHNVLDANFSHNIYLLWCWKKLEIEPDFLNLVCDIFKSRVRHSKSRVRFVACLRQVLGVAGLETLVPSQISKNKNLKKNRFRSIPTGVNPFAFHRVNSSNDHFFNFFPFFTCLLLQGLLHILFFLFIQKIQKCPYFWNWIFTFFSVLPLLASIAPRAIFANTGGVKENAQNTLKMSRMVAIDNSLVGIELGWTQWPPKSLRIYLELRQKRFRFGCV